jgi:glycine/D-amino acid oxidase-like deaminating enzyme
MTNNSPWIHQLNHERETRRLNQDLSTDVAVIGAGIAGISTAFYLLKNTDKKVVILEGYKLAHGATGHNAGQMVTYFEREFSDIVKEFGVETACQGQKDIDSAWKLVEEMYTEAKLDIPMSRFTSYEGFSTKEQVINHLENDYLRRSGGLFTYPLEISEDAEFLHEIPEKYHKLFTLISREDISLKLETFDNQYVAVLTEQKGVMNSALFCQEVSEYLMKSYPERFALYEYTPIGKVVVHEEKVLLDAGSHTIECEQVVLCTNGFENIEILVPAGLSVNTRFHHALHGVVGFMSGYLEPHTGVPAAISYFQKFDPGLTDNPGDPYFYVTRRAYEYEKKALHNLVCVGGPDFALEKRTAYDRELEFSEKAKKQIDDFIRRTYDKKESLEYLFMWHGVMGYTKNMLRMVGPDPSFSRLYYNLGCNGVGLLPSIFGGNKVARQIAGEKFEPSIFDVPLVIDGESEKKPEAAISPELPAL